MSFLSGIWIKVVGVGLFLAGLGVFVLRIMAAGAAKEKVKQLEKQVVIGKETRKVAADMRKKTKENFKNEITKINSGDYSSFNDD